MMYILYNMLLHVIGIILSPLLLVMISLNTYDIRQRLGFWSSVRDTHPENTIWFHAASMGEVTALATVVHEIRRVLPHQHIVVSTTTTTGRNRAKELIASAEGIFLAPLDVPWVVHRVLRRLRPKALILTETELWPNLIVKARGSDCKIALINGRITERTLRRSLRVKGLFRHVLKRFDLLCVQTEVDRDRFQTLGAAGGKIVVLGNLKFDLLQFLTKETGANVTRESLGISPTSKVLIAGSTRPGEEELLVSGYRTIQKALNDTVFIIAPRHLERIGDVEHILTEHGLDFSRRSDLHPHQALRSGIVLLDTMGELSHLYSCTDIAFVGGSLVPLGGHNPLEPAMWGVPVLFGPYRDNIRQLTDLLITEKASIEIRNGDDFGQIALRLLQDPDRRKRMGEAALKVVEANSGVASRTAQLLRERDIV